MDLRVAIFDDNAKRREGLQLLIDSTEEMTFVGSWPDCRDVVRHITESSPDVVLMDIDMPHVDGIAGVALIRKQFKDVKILMQTVFEDNEKIFEAILAGANGYLLKQTAPTKLIDGIIEVAQGGAPMTPIVASKVLKLFAQRGSGSSKTVDFNLTDREVEILKLLVDGFSYKMIAEKCGITYATVNTHVSHIYEKLQVKSVAGAVSLAVREGLV
ncbi:MAG: response regulator transcription factor [Flavobacteriales bacterium]|nr:response regulator transcription factor [Flavobacteriales bacterium]MBL0036019.1 response regulator transcription factor [Flavobacteriales bacterium]MBP7450152.1 response regulator transcription factor [Flavobacteriales bacterium]